MLKLSPLKRAGHTNPNYNEPMTDPAEKGTNTTGVHRPNRPLPLKLILWVLVLWTLLGWLRFGQALAERELIMSLLSPGLYVYLVLAGLIWGLLGLPVIWGLIRRALWTPTVLVITSALYPALYWLERLLIWQDPTAHRNWPFMLLLTLVWFGLVYWGLYVARLREFFNKDY